MKNLKIYKASAGSGKTFTLAVQYISLLVNNPNDYKHILAVTFTNKATNEMKSRIIETLYKIANNDPSANTYIDKIQKTLCEKYDETVIRERCALSLNLILHDYSHFRIETIDSFFQSIIRDLAHELNLTANLHVDLNKEEVLSEAVRLLIEDLDNKDSSLLSAIQLLVEEKIREGKSWEITDEVEAFSKNIFTETYLINQANISNELSDFKKFKSYKSRLNTIKEKLSDQINQCAQTFFDFCKEYGLAKEEFYNSGRGTYSYFEKIKDGEYATPSVSLIKCLQGDVCWLKNREHVYDEFFNNIAQLTIDRITKGNQHIITCSLILQHIDKLRLLSIINKKVRQLNAEANRFIIADTAHFLNQMIDSSDVPFIYEKTGSNFNHIMIDEFQDTSSMQWENFKPLINNSLSNNKFCLIVGDVKQSIYRWRNSDWTILNEIEKSEFHAETDVIALDINFRSDGEIIRFNNWFFDKAISVVAEISGNDTIKQTYSSLFQHIHKEHESSGYVNVEYLNYDTFKESMLVRLAETILQLKDNGVQENDITLLLRKNKEIEEINNFFSENYPDISIVSDYAFRLDSSKSIRIIINAMRVIAHPNNSLYIEQLLHSAGINDNADTLNKKPDELLKLLPEAFYTNIERLYMTPLFELAENLYDIFSLDTIPQQDSYLFYFYDTLTEYVSHKHSDIDNFLTYWDDTLCEKTIPSGKSCGIRAYTIHKSKGLEFHTVICPSCNWEFIPNDNDTMWCQPNEQPYNDVSLAIISNKQQVKESIFKDDYLIESTKTLVDNLNLMYVAFTRAKENLIIFTPEKKLKSNKEEKGANLISRIIRQVIGETGITRGKIERSKTKNEGKNENEQGIIVNFNNEGSIVEFRQSNKADDFFSNENNEKNIYRNDGIIIHRILEFITSPKDIDKAIRKLKSDGEITDDVYEEKIRRCLNLAFENEQVQRWFDPHWNVLSECNILYKNAQNEIIQRRPDRVICDDKETIIIDYKSGNHREEHKQQIREYIMLLYKMGYKNIKGFIWYIKNCEIVSV